MRKQHRRHLLIWLALLVLAAAEFGISFLPLPADDRPFLMVGSAAMAVLVVFGYMRLASAPDLARGFTIAGVFWLTVLLGLAMMDPLTRVVYAVSQ